MATESQSESDNDISQQRTAKRHKPNNVTSASDPNGTSGWIESVELVNFMCHRWLEIKLGPKINFIVGVYHIVIVA